MTEPRSLTPKLDGILAGSDEPVFRVLPQRVLDDMRRANSESALIWNLLYPRAQPTISMSQLLALPPLWGSGIDPINDELEPYYWGYSQEGTRLRDLDRVLDAVDGSGPQTEVDLYLLGRTELVLVEAKHMARFGRCGRYGSHRCPEIHAESPQQSCRYWTEDTSLFSDLLDFGPKPQRNAPAPPCNRHYQLGRTVLVGQALAERLERKLHFWVVLPRERWGTVEADWIDFSERVADNQLWRRLRALTWEDIHQLT